MNLYDFDETIYDGDCTRDLCLWLYRHHPMTLLYLPKQAKAFVDYTRGKIDKQGFKEAYFSMFGAVDDMRAEVSKFWDAHQDRIIEYYPPQARMDDLVISASPTFIVKPMCARLGITRVLASEVDPETGKFSGKNCYGVEKVHRFLEAGYNPDEVEQFYSDSCSDNPLAELAEEAFIVTKKGLTGWEPPQQHGMQAFFTLFNKPEAMMSILFGLLHVIVSGHLARLLTQRGRKPVLSLAATSLGIGGAMVGALAIGEKKNEKLGKVRRVLTGVLAVTGICQLALVAGATALLGFPVLSLVLAALAGVGLVYTGVRFAFDKKKTGLLSRILKGKSK